MTKFHSLTETNFDAKSTGLHSHPEDVLADQCLSDQDRRALLASWASDANAVTGVPWLRQLPSGSLVKLSEIFRALRALDALPEDSFGPSDTVAIPFKRRFGKLLRNSTRFKRRRDDDDDPPPCPAFAVRQPRGGGGAAHTVPEPLSA